MPRSRLQSPIAGVVAGSLVALSFGLGLPARAHAFGGLWSSGTTPVKQSALEVLLVSNPDATQTAAIRIAYSGPAQRLAWVIPVPGMPEVAISSNVAFDRLALATAPQYWVEVASQGTCADDGDAGLDAGTGSPGAPTPGDANENVIPVDHGSAGPYEYVTLAVSATLEDPADAARGWLSANGFPLTGMESAALNPYLRGGFNLLAWKLDHAANAGMLQPIVLTYSSEQPRVPIRATAVGAQDDMRVAVYVVGPAQAVPSNYVSLVLDDARIDWLSGRKFPSGTLPSGGAGLVDSTTTKEPTNYAAVVNAAADEAGGHGFVTELAAPASQFRERVWSPLDENQFALLTRQSYDDPIDAVIAARERYAGWDGFEAALAASVELPASIAFDGFAADPGAYRGRVNVDTDALFQRLETDVLKPVADTAALLYRAPYLTRLFTTLSPDEMTLDPLFDYNADLAQIGNVQIAKQVVACRSTRERDDAPWWIDLPQGGVVVGHGDTWPADVERLPANLEIVMLSDRGSGLLLTDNRQAIAKGLFAQGAFPGEGAAVPMLPVNGAIIGAVHSVRPRPPSIDDIGLEPDAGARRWKLSGGSDCSVGEVGGEPDRGRARALSLSLLCALALLARRRRRMRSYPEGRSA